MMKRMIVFTALLAFLTQPVLAGSLVEISKKDCQRIARLKPQAGAAYQPGVDVRGNKVAGADLNGGSPIKIPNIIQFDLNADMTRYMSANAADKLGDANAKIGTIKYDIMSGKITFNDQSLTGPAEDEIKARCAELLGVNP